MPRNPEGERRSFEPGEEPVYDEDGNLLAVGYNPPDTENVEQFWRHQRHAKLEAANEAARRLAPTLVGLTVAQAQHVVDQHAGLSVAFRQAGHAYPPIGTFGEIDAVLVEDVVIEAV